MRTSLRFLLITAGLVFAPAWALGAGSAGEPGPKNAEFDRRFAEWKGILAELYELRGEFRGTPLSRQVELDERYRKLLEEGEAMLPGLRAAAAAAYSEAPDSSSYPAEFLLRTVADHVGRGMYEQAFSIAKLLFDHGFDPKINRGFYQKDIYVLAGIAAFAANEFDLAKEWLRLADENNVLGRLAAKAPRQAQVAQTALRSCASYKEAWRKELAIRAAEAKANASPETQLPRVLLRTTKGDIELELFENEAPNTVNNFIALVEQGIYNGIAFYGVSRLSGAEAGGMVRKDGDVDWILHPQSDPPKRVRFRGSIVAPTVASSPGKGTSQFRLLVLPQPSGKDTCFGRITKGLDVVGRLRPISPKEFANAEPDTIDRIVEAKVLRKRNHPYELKKVPEPKPGPVPPLPK